VSLIPLFVGQFKPPQPNFFFTNNFGESRNHPNLYVLVTDSRVARKVPSFRSHKEVIDSLRVARDPPGTARATSTSQRVHGRVNSAIRASTTWLRFLGAAF
jgi:hypothetical protein